jgi:serine protease Do
MKWIAVFLLNLAVAAAQGPLRQLSSQFESLVEKTDPAVVQIVVRAFASTEGENTNLIRSARGNGSGVIVTADGYIITNAHVVHDARRIQVLIPRTLQPTGKKQSVLKANGKLVEARLIGQDRETDIAVLKVEESQPLPWLSFGDSESLREGEIVFAFGSPLGLDNSVTMGIVSAPARQIRPEDPMIYIQTDAAINPGNSGGPLVDAEGRVVGINTFILSNSGGSQGIGFAAPSNLVKVVFEQIRDQGRVKRGQIGVLAHTLNPQLIAALQLERDTGVLIEDVTPGSSAEAAGLKIGDLVLRINGKPLENARQFGLNIYQNAGQTIELEVLRGKATQSIRVAVLERPRDPDRLLAHLKGERSRVRKLGILAVDLDENVLPMFPNLREFTGVAVAGVTSDLALEPNGLRPGDIIHEINREDVLNLENLRRLLENLKHGEAVVVQIERSGQMQFILLEID